MNLLDTTDSIAEMQRPVISTNQEMQEKKISLETYKTSSKYTEKLLEKIRLEREVEEKNRKNKLFIFQLSLFVLIGLAIIYFFVEATVA